MGQHVVEFGAGLSNAGRPRLSIRLKASIETAVQIKAIKPAELERVIVDTTVQEKAIAHPVDSRLLETLRHKAGGYAHAKQFQRLKKVVKRQPTILGVVSLAVTHKQGLMVGARSFTGNPFDGHILAAQLEQTTILLQDLQRSPKQVIVDLGFRGVDADNPGVEIIHRGKYKSLTTVQRRWLNRRQAIEPMIGHAKSDNRMDRCWLKGALGDALHALSCALGYNIRWLMRAIVRLGIGVVFLRLLLATLMAPMARPSSVRSSHASPLAAWARSAAGRLTWSAPAAAIAAA